MQKLLLYYFQSGRPTFQYPYNNFFQCHAAEHLELKLDYNAKLDDSGDVSFSCNTKGLLVTSTIWKINNSVIPHKSVEKVDMLIDPYTPSHFSEVTKHGANLSSLSDSSLTCDVYSNWVVADQSTFGQQRKLNQNILFVLSPAGGFEIASITLALRHIVGPSLVS